MAGVEGRRAVKVWFGPEEFAVVDGAARVAGVETGALVREAALWSAAAVGREVSAGRVRLRRRSVASVPVSAVAGRNSLDPEEASGGVVHGVGGMRRDTQPARPASAPSVDPGVERALLFRRLTQGARPAAGGHSGSSDSI